MPYFFELALGRDVPSTAFLRVFRMLRILKTERFTGAVDAAGGPERKLEGSLTASNGGKVGDFVALPKVM